MSASEWDRIIEERDSAIFHLRQLLLVCEECNVRSLRIIDAVDFLSESFGDEYDM